MRAVIFAIFFILVSETIISAKVQNIQDLGLKGIELSYDMRSDEANRIFDEIIRMDPENPMGYFFKSANYFLMFNYDRKLGDLFKELSFKAAHIAEEMLDKNENNIDALFYAGGAYGNIGRYYAMTNSWLKSYWYGRKGKNYLEKVIEKDPDYYDAYVGLGIYHYYVGVAPKYIKVLSFLLGVKGNREKGLNELILASEKGNYTRDEAKFFLADIYHDIENNSEAALQLWKELSDKYPHNPMINIELARCYRNVSRYDLSVRTIINALELESLNRYQHWRGQLYFDLGITYSAINEYEQAVSSFENALTVPQLKAWALFYIGDSYEMIGIIDKAREHFSQIKEKDNESAYKNAQERMKNPVTPARINLKKGSNYLRYGKIYKAKTIFNDLIKSEMNKTPLNDALLAETYYYLGIAEYNLKNYQDSIQAFQKVLIMDDNSPDWIKSWSHVFLGHCYMVIGETQKAKIEYDIAYEYKGKNLRLEVDKARSSMN